MPKKKGNNLPKGARQSKREKKQIGKQDVAPTPVQDAVEDVAVTA